MVVRGGTDSVSRYAALDEVRLEGCHQRRADTPYVASLPIRRCGVRRLEIDTAKEKAVSARSMTKSLTTFGDLYDGAAPEQRRELIRLRLNRVVWNPGKIRLALFDGPAT